MGLALQNSRLVFCTKAYFDRIKRVDVEDFFIANIRGFPDGDNFLHRFRIRPNAALIRNIAMRVKGYTNEMHQAKIRNF